MKLTAKMTERDKKLLMAAGVVLVAFVMFTLVLRPIRTAAENMQEQVDSNEQTIMEMQQKEVRLPMVERMNGEKKEELEAFRSRMYPIMRSKDVDRVLTDKVLRFGLRIDQLQISMPDTPANMASYGRSGESSNPNRKEGIYIAQVNLNVSGVREELDALVDHLSKETSGVRITSLNWGNTRDRDVDGVIINRPSLSMHLEVYMCNEYNPDEEGK